MFKNLQMQNKELQAETKDDSEPKPIATTSSPNAAKPNVSGSVCDHPPRNRHYYNDSMYKCYKCEKIIKQTDR